MSHHIRKLVTGVLHIFAWSVLGFAVGVSLVGLLSQAVRTSRRRSFKNNIDVLIIITAYSVVILTSLAFCLKRRISMFRKLQRLSRGRVALSKGDIPKHIHGYVTQEYSRACLIAFESLPKDADREGWGRPGTRWDGVCFRRFLLDTVPDLGPSLKQHAPPTVLDDVSVSNAKKFWVAGPLFFFFSFLVVLSSQTPRLVFCFQTYRHSDLTTACCITIVLSRRLCPRMTKGDLHYTITTLRYNSRGRLIVNRQRESSRLASQRRMRLKKFCLRPERKCSRVRPPTPASFLLDCNWQPTARSLALVYCISPDGNQPTGFMP